MAAKKRLDVVLVEQGFYENRSKAKRAIMAGKILVDGELVDKAGTQVKEDAFIKSKGEILPYVSRGGFKLEKALNVFAVETKEKSALDIGASTGGFTDCLLQNGVNKVYAVDVGYGQLDWELRNDKRVVVIERTNFRYLTREELDIEVPLIVTDVSFISLKLIIPPALKFLVEDGDIIALIKPQFEAGLKNVGKNGVVRKKKIHMDILKEMIDFFIELDLSIKGLDFSPITGASSKNIEFLIHIKKSKSQLASNESLNINIEDIVEKAHYQLERG